MPLILVTDGAPEALDDQSLASIEMVGRNCPLEDQDPIKLNEVPSFRLSGEMIAYASPDSTYAVTRRLLDGARKSILIGIYDFSAGYVKDVLLQAMRRNVKVSLMLDLDGVKGELPIFEELQRFGAETVPAPSCASDNLHYFRSSHEKVIVIDGVWTLVQSGNYSANSIPFNEKDGGDPENFIKGNRDVGLAIRSKALAEFFTRVLRADMKLETDAADPEALPGLNARAVQPPDLVEAVPELLPVKLFPSKTLNPDRAVTVTPVLTPDNYMDVVPQLLRSATKSLLIEEQYIRGKDEAIRQLLEAIRAAMERNPQLDVRIILGKIFGGQRDVEKERKNLANIRRDFGLKLGSNIRLIDTKRFIHCHNKMIVVDGEAVLVGSQNWSKAAVLENREASLLVRYPELARYYAEIFESDWSTARNSLPGGSPPETITPEVLAAGNFVEVSYGDYVQL